MIDVLVEGLRTAWPRAEIVIAADNDASGAGMDGARRGKPDYIVMPDKVGDDWNDVLVKEGREAVLSGAQTRIVRVMASGFRCCRHARRRATSVAVWQASDPWICVGHRVTGWRG